MMWMRSFRALCVNEAGEQINKQPSQQASWREQASNLCVWSLVWSTCRKGPIVAFISNRSWNKKERRCETRHTATTQISNSIQLPISIFECTHMCLFVTDSYFSYLRVDGIFACPHCHRRHIQTTQLIWERASQICKQQIAYTVDTESNAPWNRENERERREEKDW